MIEALPLGPTVSQPSVCDLVLHSHTQPTMKEGSGQTTVLVFVKSLARFLAILVGDKLLIIFIMFIILYNSLQTTPVK